MWPDPTKWQSSQQLPDDVFISLGSASDYILDPITDDISAHTNPAVIATRQVTGEKVVLKLKLGDGTAMEYARRGSITVESNGRHPVIAASPSGVFSQQWPRCESTKCKSVAQDLGVSNSRVRHVPFINAELSRLQAAAGIGSAKDEIFVHAVLAPEACNDLNSGITPLLDVIEFSHDDIPVPLQALAMRKLKDSAKVPAEHARFVYALVFPKYRALKQIAERDIIAETRGLLSALATASQRGIINVDLRHDHVMLDPRDLSYRLMDWDNAVTVSAAAGKHPIYRRDSTRSCAIDQPSVPVHAWGEFLESNIMSLPPELLLSWLDRGRRGCRFTPAIDIWHAGLRLARTLGCRGNLQPVSLSNVMHGNETKSVLSSIAKLFGTDALYRMLDKYGWQLDLPCNRICQPASAPLMFEPNAIRDCLRQCNNRARIEPALVDRTANVPPHRIDEWCRARTPSKLDPTVFRNGLDLVSKMLAIDPAERVDAATALQHPLLNNSQTAPLLAEQTTLLEDVIDLTTLEKNAPTLPASLDGHNSPRFQTWAGGPPIIFTSGCSREMICSFQLNRAREAADGNRALSKGSANSKLCSTSRRSPTPSPSVAYVLAGRPIGAAESKASTEATAGAVRHQDILRMHLTALKETSSVTSQLFIMIPGTSAASAVEEAWRNVDTGSYLDIRHEAAQLPFPATLVRLPNNTLGSYGMYLTLYAMSASSSGAKLFDYYMFSEDDYLPVQPAFDRILLGMYDASFRERPGILCGLLQGKPLEPSSPYLLHCESSHIMSASSLRGLFERAIAHRLWPFRRQGIVKRQGRQLKTAARHPIKTSATTKARDRAMDGGKRIAPCNATGHHVMLLADALLMAEGVCTDKVKTALKLRLRPEEIRRMCPEMMNNRFNRIQIAFGSLLRATGIEMRDWSAAFRTPYWDHKTIVDWSGAIQHFQVPIRRVLFAPVQWLFSPSVRICCVPEDCSIHRNASALRMDVDEGQNSCILPSTEQQHHRAYPRAHCCSRGAMSNLSAWYSVQSLRHGVQRAAPNLLRALEHDHPEATQCEPLKAEILLAEARVMTPVFAKPTLPWRLRPIVVMMGSSVISALLLLILQRMHVLTCTLVSFRYAPR